MGDNAIALELFHITFAEGAGATCTQTKNPLGMCEALWNMNEFGRGLSRPSWVGPKARETHVYSASLVYNGRCVWAHLPC